MLECLGSGRSAGSEGWRVRGRLALPSCDSGYLKTEPTRAFSVWTLGMGGVQVREPLGPSAFLPAVRVRPSELRLP